MSRICYNYSSYPSRVALTAQRYELTRTSDLFKRHYDYWHKVINNPPPLENQTMNPVCNRILGSFQIPFLNDADAPNNFILTYMVHNNISYDTGWDYLPPEFRKAMIPLSTPSEELLFDENGSCLGNCQKKCISGFLPGCIRKNQAEHMKDRKKEYIRKKLHLHSFPIPINNETLNHFVHVMDANVFTAFIPVENFTSKTQVRKCLTEIRKRIKNADKTKRPKSTHRAVSHGSFSFEFTNSVEQLPTGYIITINRNCSNKLKKIISEIEKRIIEQYPDNIPNGNKQLYGTASEWLHFFSVQKYEKLERKVIAKKWGSALAEQVDFFNPDTYKSNSHYREVRERILNNAYEECYRDKYPDDETFFKERKKRKVNPLEKDFRKFYNKTEQTGLSSRVYPYNQIFIPRFSNWFNEQMELIKSMIRN